MFTMKLTSLESGIFATSRNYGLYIFAEIDCEVGDSRLERYNFLGEDVARRTPPRPTRIS